MGKDEETDMRNDPRRKRLGCASDIIVRCSMLDVRPARNALIAVCVQFNHLIYFPMLARIKCNMHGRRVFDLLFLCPSGESNLV
jgi:hypothetical protein